MHRRIGVLPAVAVWTATGLAARWWWRRLRAIDLDGRVVLITGASRGLGLVLAERFAARGARLALCARTAKELNEAAAALEARGAEVFPVACDVTQHDQVASMVELVSERFGRIDVLVNNAGVLTVGPIGALRREDFDEAMDTMFWGVLHPTLALLPQFRGRRTGTIVNITSIGGKLSFPHLLPYNTAKFAAVGLSEGLHAELMQHGIRVVTIVPGFMRTGSHVNAEMQGQPTAEYTWFAVGGTTPLTSAAARRAAERIVRAAERGEAEVTITVQAKLAARAVGLAPGLVADALGMVARMLPGPGRMERRKGGESETVVTRSFLTSLGRRAATRYHQHPERLRPT